MGISYNVLSVPSESVHEAHISALQPKWILYKDNFSYAVKIARMLPKTVVIHRDWSGYLGDDDLPRKVTPQAWLDGQRKLGSLNIWRYCLNESGFDDRVLAWINSAIEINAQSNEPLHLVIGNFSAGTPNPDAWKTPAAVKLLHYLDMYRQWLVLGLHEYFAAVPTSGYYVGYPSNANIASNPDDASGSKGLNLIPMDKWPKDTRGITLWHCGRFRFLLQACDSLGIPYPRIVVTEHGTDDLSDIKPWLDTLQKTPPYPNIRGWRSLERQWQAWYDSGIDLTYYNMLTYLDAAVYAGSPVEAQLIFAWGDSGGWEQFKVDNAPELQQRLAMYAGAPPPPVVTPPEPPPQNQLDTAALLTLVSDVEDELIYLVGSLSSMQKTISIIKDALK